MVADEFLRKIGAEMERSAQSKDLEWTCSAVEGGSAGGKKKERSLGARRNEGGSLNVELIDGMSEAWALQHAGKIGDDASAAAGNRGTILPVPDVARAEFSGAAAD